MRLLLYIGEADVGFFVQPVGSNAGLGDALHLMRANLELHRFADVVQDDGVQGLVAVFLRNGDVVFESSRYGVEQTVQDTEAQIAVAARVDQHAKAVHVHDFGQGQLFVFHLVVGAGEVFFAAKNVCLNLRGGKALTNLVNHFAK